MEQHVTEANKKIYTSGALIVLAPHLQHSVAHHHRPQRSLLLLYLLALPIQLRLQLVLLPLHIVALSAAAISQPDRLGLVAQAAQANPEGKMCCVWSLTPPGSTSTALNMFRNILFCV